MGKRVVKNFPSPRLMETIGATNQKPFEAIGELVANSFDARNGDEKLRIVVDMRDHQIKVIDNGKGMTSEILEKAVCIGEDMSQHIERGEDAKGYFGMGFKTSCSTLGKYYEIFTRPAEEQREYRVGFDINEYSHRPSDENAWNITIEDEVRFNESPLEKMDHGTAFVITQLKDSNIFVSKVLDYMGEAFKGHLETGDSIIIIDESGIQHVAIPKTYNFIKGTKIDINEVFGPNDKYKITGWMALDSQTHNDGHYGFNIYRHGQLVEKWDKSWFNAHLMRSRIIGEVNMDFLDATFYKQGVQQSEDWNYVEAHMKKFLKYLVTASNNVSKKGNIHKPEELKRIVNTLRSDYGVVSTIEEPDEDVLPEENDVKSFGTSINNNIKTIVKEKELILEDEGSIHIVYLEKESRGNVNAPFDYIYSGVIDDTPELQVIMYKDHPLWSKRVDNEVIKILATSDAIYRMLVEKLGKDTSEALKIRNEWLNERTRGMGD